MSPPVPGLLRRVLERALPLDVREGIVGDLDEVYAARMRTHGALRARLWYAGQVAAISGRFLPERARDAASSAHASVGLDVKLGLRMLVKYPMLTLVGGVAIMVASGLGVAGSEFVRDMIAPRLPLDEGDRVVRVYQADAETGRPAAATLYDLSVWETSVPGLEDLGAYQTLEQGVQTDRGVQGTVHLARVTPSAFRLTRVPPIMGRFLIDADARPGAEAVMVVGFDVWRSLLDADPDPVGRTVLVAGSPHTVVGVMPEGYGFPMMQDAWVPLVADVAAMQAETAPRAAVFARLASGVDLDAVQAQLEVAGARARADAPEVYQHLSPRVDLFASRASSLQATLILSGVGLLFTFLLVVACANVATLVFARTVMREGEIAVRMSLGATRSRIVLQLFAEALVLVGGATLLGLMLAAWALGRISALFFVVQQAPRPPFWWDDALSPATVGYALLLALVGSVMVGVVPAWKATSGEVKHRLGRHAEARGGGLRFGGIWTVVIVLQVALTVAFLPLAVSQAGTAFQSPVASNFPAAEYVTAQLGRTPSVPARTEEDAEASHAEAHRLFLEVRDRIAADPAVRGAALASGLSAMNHVGTPFEFVDGVGETIAGYARILLVDEGYLDLMDATVVAGDGFGPADHAPESRAVLVNEAFVRRIVGGRNAVGATLRFPERAGEASVVSVPASGSTVNIVGVVRDPGIDAYGPGVHPAIYAPLALAPVSPRASGMVGMPQAPAAQLFLRLGPGAGEMAGRLYGIVASVDPALRLSEMGTAAEAWAPVHTGARLGGWVFVAVAAIVLMLSVAGIYALMSFTVSRRTREIAIRTAVGAPRSRIVRIIFQRAVLQLLAGVVLGSLVAIPVLRDGISDEGPRALIIVATLLLGAGTAACLVPVRRALAVDPAVAMKAE